MSSFLLLILRDLVWILRLRGLLRGNVGAVLLGVRVWPFFCQFFHGTREIERRLRHTFNRYLCLGE